MFAKSPEEMSREHERVTWDFCYCHPCLWSSFSNQSFLRNNFVVTTFPQFSTWVINPCEKYSGALFSIQFCYHVYCFWHDLIGSYFIYMSVNVTKSWATLEDSTMLIEPGTNAQWVSKLNLLTDLWWVHMNISYLQCNIANNWTAQKYS